MFNIVSCIFNNSFFFFLSSKNKFSSNIDLTSQSNLFNLINSKLNKFIYCF